MNRIVLVLLLLVASAGAVAQHSSRGPDTIGAHINYGRGCPACHVPHSPALNYAKSSFADAKPRCSALWGEDATSPYPIGYGESAPKPPFRVTANSPETMGILTCRSCHDGNYAPSSMIKNTIYETLPDHLHGAIDSVPTLMDKPSVNLGSDFSEHPAGLDTRIGCGGSLNWDCTQSSGAILMGGPRSSMFAEHYGFFIKPHIDGENFIVVCTTCHNPHSMNLTRVTKETASNLFSVGTYPTKHFLRAPYDPDNASKTSNQSAQFCRQCHADKSNEMNGGNFGSSM